MNGIPRLGWRFDSLPVPAGDRTDAKKTNPQVKGSEAWGWLPPPLMDEGEKVQTDWLHGFLMDPTPIRPAVVMRMPNFHMSSDEAADFGELLCGLVGCGVSLRVQSQPERELPRATRGGTSRAVRRKR